MSVAKLQNYLPEGTMTFLKKWFADYFIHIKITKNRDSKLGDYRKMPDGSHKITINSTLEPELFFFVLTHELAHMAAFEKFGRRITPHGQEWKTTFRDMLIESLSAYSEGLRPVILRYSINPKANFMASPELVMRFRREDIADGHIYAEKILPGEAFVYRGRKYKMLGRRKMNYLCQNISTGKEYIFKPLAEVRKIEHDEPG